MGWWWIVHFKKKSHFNVRFSGLDSEARWDTKIWSFKIHQLSMLSETHSDNLASLLSNRSEALCPKSLLELTWMADQPCEHVSKLEAGKSIRFLSVALQKRFSGGPAGELHLSLPCS